MTAEETNRGGSAYVFVYNDNGPGQVVKSSWPVIRVWSWYCSCWNTLGLDSDKKDDNRGYGDHDDNFVVFNFDEHGCVVLHSDT
eukprot:CAMPEP_0171345034 /NCGR_PEP_ID=MMETSP0878-20121228/20757_1 /TAXON_ID=67004 /ORGANISM="Thalassiosira weissflogii, Strain CCMP1336" /LENGTH=83 /DNA_ID=CAMNT_0011848365 /DNA_START=195 /DNA_END=442 /DNA_ORIENTATION=+